MHHVHEILLIHIRSYWICPYDRPEWQKMYDKQIVMSYQNIYSFISFICFIYLFIYLTIKQEAVYWSMRLSFRISISIAKLILL